MAKLEKGTAGRYTAEAERLLRETGAETVVLLVLGGKKGDGFCVSGRSLVGGSKSAQLLRSIADAMDGQAPDGIEKSE